MFGSRNHISIDCIFCCGCLNSNSKSSYYPLDTGRKLDVQRQAEDVKDVFGSLLNVLFTFNLRLVNA